LDWQNFILFTVSNGASLTFEYKGGHGGALVPMVNAVCAHPKLTWVCARNEHDAATMAAAYAKMTGGLGVVIATSGPGATNLVTGLLEAVLDQCALLAITGLKPTEVIGYSEFQDVAQSRIFAAGGIEWSKNAASPQGVIPLLRDAVATALSRRTCAHLAIPVDIQAAPSPLALKYFCASHANLGLLNHPVDHDQITKVAEMLVGPPEERPPRNVIAVGLKAVYQKNGEVSRAILDLAEALNAPVLTRLDAKGVVDERHPLALGVIGVHGKPGMEKAAALISTSDRIISIGVADETLLLCNSAGLQIRKLIEIQPDALCVSTRYNADETLLGDITKICSQLTERVEAVMVRVEKKRAVLNSKPKAPAHTREISQIDQLAYMCFSNPNVEVFLPSLTMNQEEFSEQTDNLWGQMQTGNVSSSVS
jgi:thiamine pyrophosphate-dependent acetolactate synthase large subunit-like protein